MKVEIGVKALGANERQAEANRRRLREAGWVAVNLLSSPGSGKTSLIEAALPRLEAVCAVAVVEGDVETARDAERVAAAGGRAVQIETRGACHLDARMVARALDELELGRPASGWGLLLVENVGNLVCPAEYLLGEELRVVLLSTPEGDDKVAKYPEVFRTADAVVLNKMDLAPYLDFRVERVGRDLAAVRPGVPVFPLSARSGEGVEAWLEWLVRNARERLELRKSAGA
ncbi:MAG: hydrogenase nickel incorporation protein HypB [Bacillota bacterium]|nr:hydrogenase nickel incorporation protein HypB [Bacillota bacterium]